MKDNRKRCSAITEKTGEQCKFYALEGTDFCRIHTLAIQPPPPPGMFPSAPPPSLLDRVVELRDDPFLLVMRTEIAVLKALLEHGLQAVESQAVETEDGERVIPDTVFKRVQSISMDILSAAEKYARIEERRRGVLTADEIGAIIDRIKERVISVVRSAKEDISPEETAKRISAAFDSIEIVGSWD